MAKRKRPNQATKDESASKAPKADDTIIDAVAVDETDSAGQDTPDSSDGDDTVGGEDTLPSDEVLGDTVDVDVPENDPESDANSVEVVEQGLETVTAGDDVEAIAEPEPEKAITPAPPPVQQVEKRSALPLVFGGVVAAALGFIAAQADLFSSGSAIDAETDALRSELNAALDRVETLEET
ncbi:MAG: hypothetical protein AAF727_10570, partial [Pseudomonadota bacterium]